MILSIPGATPQSTIAVTFFSLARASNSKEFSGKKEMSTTFISLSMIVFKVSKPKKPGTAQITKSCLTMEFFSFALSVTSSCSMTSALHFSLTFSKTFGLKSVKVTLCFFERSMAMALPTIPAPNTIILLIFIV